MKPFVILSCALLFSTPLSHATTQALPAGFQMPSTAQIAKYMRTTNGAAIAISFAVKQLVKGVDWIIDNAGHRVIVYDKTKKVCKGHQRQIGGVRERRIGEPKALAHEFCSGIAGYAPEKTTHHKAGEEAWANYCYNAKGDGIGYILIYCNYPSETYIPYNQIAAQIIKNARAGHQPSIDFVKAAAADAAKQNTKPRDTTKPTPPPQTTPKPKPEPTKPPKKDEPKTCAKDFKEYKMCINLREDGFVYSAKSDALKASGIIGSAPSKTDSYNRFCGRHGTHTNYRPTKKTQSSRTPSFAGTISSCQCCQDSLNGAKIITIYKAN